MKVNWPAVGAVVLPNAGGWLGGIVVAKNMQWYESLRLASWRPPNWAFGPVWTVLYSGMGYASYLVYRDGGGFNGNAKLPLMLYGSHLLLNWAWTPVFFGTHNIKLAFFEILCLDAAAVATGNFFYKINPIAGYIFAPYLLWLGIATALNYNTWKLNSGSADGAAEAKAE